MTSTFSRRICLQVGSLSAFGLSLPTLLRAEADPVTKPAAEKRLKSVILVYLGGGLSHHDSFDLKSEAPDEIRGNSSPTGTPGRLELIGVYLPRISSGASGFKSKVS